MTSSKKWLVLGLAVLAAAIAGRQWMRGVMRQHARPDAPELHFGLSLEGSRIVFCGKGRGGADLFLLDGRVGKVSRVAATPMYESDRAFSPDGRSIVYAAGDGERADHIFTRSLVSGRVRQLTAQDFNDSHPAFAPDGRSVVFVRDHRYITGGLATWGMWDHAQIYTVSADGSGLRQLTNGPYLYADSAHFTPDDKAVVFGYARDLGLGSTRDEIGTVPSRSSARAVTTLTQDGYSSQPAISPDGKRIAFACVTDDPNKGYGERRIFLMDAQGRGRLLLPGQVWSDQPAFSPDGQQIFFIGASARPGSVQKGLWRMNVDGSHRIQIAPGGLLQDPLRWKLTPQNAATLKYLR